MLATILKSERAARTTITIIDTFFKSARNRTNNGRPAESNDGGNQQKNLLQKSGNLLADVIGNNLSTQTIETEIEFNFAVVKIKHKTIRKNK